ncbi:MAG: hypothetical protein JNN10_09255 [Sphingopyxis sp.]|uniref:hypothetical protein n=1 Tax=Sphingopyxis sp. TaxID=1908224 RepID=UPI001A61BCEA|nr:hypothetical protein [Sphingopyxis sp.]MBL9066466.1 hypothetical protein [Sphingopyxis sp.]
MDEKPKSKRLGRALARLANEVYAHRLQIPPHVIDEAEKMQPALDRYKHARTNPDDPKAEPWLALGSMTPRQAKPFLPWLPDILKRRGRPKGSKLAAELEQAMESGEDEAVAAARLIDAAPGDKKHRKDYLRKLRKGGIK